MKIYDNSWYLVYTRPHQEKKLASNLNEHQIEYYLPTIKTLRQWRDRKKVIDMPLFPSYLFCRIKNANDYYNSCNSEGFLYYVKSGKEVVRVAEKIIDNIRIAVDYGNEIEVSLGHFQAGQYLVIQQGPLTGLSCQVVKYKNEKKILVRIDMLQRYLLLSLPSTSLAAPCI